MDSEVKIGTSPQQTDLVFAAKEKLMQIFSQVHGQALYQSRFDHILMLATHKNPTAKTLSEEIEWELSAFDKVK